MVTSLVEGPTDWITLLSGNTQHTDTTFSGDIGMLDSEGDEDGNSDFTDRLATGSSAKGGLEIVRLSTINPNPIIIPTSDLTSRDVQQSLYFDNGSFMAAMSSLALDYNRVYTMFRLAEINT